MNDMPEMYKVPGDSLRQWYGAVFDDGSRIEGPLEVVQGAIEDDRRFKQEEEEHIKRCRSLGIKAYHPDDGWHNREEHYFELCYPHFNDGIAVGDMVWVGKPRKVIRIEDSKFFPGSLLKYYYEHEEPIMQKPEKRSSLFRFLKIFDFLDE